MNDAKIGRRERRRRKMEMKMEENHLVGNEFQKTIENVEFSIKPHVIQSLGKLVRRDTYTVLHSKSDFDSRNGEAGDNGEQDFDLKNGEGSRSDSVESRNLTYNLNKDSENSNNYTFNIRKPIHAEEIRPIPAPRKWKSVNLELEKVSSDTDRDITEIDLDDMLVKSPKSDLSSKTSMNSNKSINNTIKTDHIKNDSVTVPIPKPRKTVKHFQKTDLYIEKPICESLKSASGSLNSNIEDSKGKSIKSDFEKKPTVGVDPSEHSQSKELPLVENLQDGVKSEVEQKTEKQKKFSRDLFDRKKMKKKSKTFSSLIKLEKKKIPKISSILKDGKEETAENKSGIEEEKIDFHVDSPHYTESAENGRIYVQGKNGFHVMEKDEVLKNKNHNSEKDENGGIMGDSTVKTAVLFQKYWSRSMTYFHGVLAGFGFSHAATVTAIMIHFNYDPEEFINVYSCLSLKIHYVFYTLTALCIVSCFDRIDIGHLNRKHWQIAWKVPSLWVILNIYVISFVLTFINQKTEARFDAFPDGNGTEIWDGYTQSQIQMSMLQWYHSVWVRDVLVLLAWLMIALTTFDDFLFSHVNNMIKYAEIKGEEKRFRRKTDFF